MVLRETMHETGSSSVMYEREARSFGIWIVEWWNGGNGKQDRDISLRRVKVLGERERVCVYRCSSYLQIHSLHSLHVVLIRPINLVLSCEIPLSPIPFS